MKTNTKMTLHEKITLRGKCEQDAKMIFPGLYDKVSRETKGRWKQTDRKINYMRAAMLRVLDFQAAF